MGSREQIADCDVVCALLHAGTGVLVTTLQERFFVLFGMETKYRAGVGKLSVRGVFQPVLKNREQLGTALPFGSDQKLHSELSKAGLWVRQPSKSNIG